MRQKFFLGVLVMITLTNPSYSMDLEGVKSKIRPFITKYFGSDISNKMFGPKGPIKELSLPSIPKVEKDATSLNTFKKIDDPFKSSVPKDKAQKYNYLFLKELYNFTRMAKISQDEMNRWMNNLTQEGTREGVYRALVLDNVYYSLEKKEYPVNKKIMEFTKWFLPRFIDRKFSEEKLKGINFFVLKRFMTSNALDVIDAFDSREDLLDWYGVFSGDVAQKYPLLWQGKMRKNVSMLVHKNWASQVPLDYLKSEILLKIHKIYNYLRQG